MARIEDVDAVFHEGVRRLKGEDYEGAIAAFDEAIARSPDLEVAYRHRAQANLLLGRVQEANADLDSVLSITGVTLPEAERARVLEVLGDPEHVSQSEAPWLPEDRMDVPGGLQEYQTSSVRVARWAIAGLLLLVVAVIVAIGAELTSESRGADSELEGDASEGQQSVVSALAIPKSTPAPKLVTFAGKANNLTSGVRLHEGLVLLSIQHQGTSNFAVEVQDESGSSVLSVNTGGRDRGTRAYQVSTNHPRGLAPGLYRLKVTADRPWQIELAQPVWGTGSLPPVGWSSKGDDVVGPIILRAGVTPAKFTHKGSSNSR